MENFDDDIIISDSDSESDIIIYGIDPGSVNCGFCEYNVTIGNAQELKRISFRKKKLDYNGKKKKILILEMLK